MYLKRYILLTYLLWGVLTALVGAELPKIKIPGPGVDINKLPGVSLMTNPRRNLDLVMMPATIEAKVDGKTLVHVNAPVYRAADRSAPYFFGPTLKLKAGATFNVSIANSLVNGKSGSELQHHVGNTNFHTHGLHAPTGKYNQDANDRTTNGDNIFLMVAGKSKPGEAAKKLKLQSSIPDTHMPGLHWYHPHVHGSTTSQTYSASGLVVVEDDPKWLPDAAGCRQVRQVLESSPDQLLHLQLMTFKAPASRNPWNDANIQLAASEGDSPLCCDDKDLYGTKTDVDIGFVNGGYQPTIRLKAGEWSRWRMAMAGYKRYMSLEILDEDGNDADCDMQLLAKDGVYLMQVPRKINYVLLPAGGRSEMLVRCRKTSKKLRVASGHQPLPFTVTGMGGGGMGGGGMGGGGMGGMGSAGVDHLFRQEVLAYVTVDDGNTETDLAEKACTPLRPDYAPDLRDTNLQAAGATRKIIYDTRATFQDSPIGCTIGGEKFSFPDPAPLLAPLGSIVEWNVFMLWNHPLHLHTNAFQITGLPGSSSLTSYFQEGDYHDTLFLPMIRGSSVAVRFQPGPYYGFSVMHCHFLQHEDAGCMKVVEWQCPAGSQGDPRTGKCGKGYIPAVQGTL